MMEKWKNDRLVVRAGKNCFIQKIEQKPISPNKGQSDLIRTKPLVQHSSIPIFPVRKDESIQPGWQ